MKCFVNAEIYTGTLPYQQVMVIESNKIIVVGSQEIIRNYPKAEIIDCQGAFICAGFNDSHMHLLNFGVSLSSLPLYEHTSSLKEMLEFVKQAQGKVEKGKWIKGRGWNQDFFMDGKKFFTRYDLDQVAPNQPVCLTRACGHVCIVNTKALELLGIDKNTPQVLGGKFDVDEQGEPLGIFRENALDLVYSKMPQPDKNELKEMIFTAMKACNTYGIT